MRTHDGGVEHLDQMRRRAHRGECIEKGLEHAGLAQPIEALPDAVPVAEPFRQRPPSHILDGEEMKRLEEPAIILALASAARKARPKYRQRMRPVFLVHPRRHGFWSPTQPESYESCPIPLGNPRTPFKLRIRPHDLDTKRCLVELDLFVATDLVGQVLPCCSNRIGSSLNVRLS